MHYIILYYQLEKKLPYFSSNKNSANNVVCQHELNLAAPQL